MFSKGESVLRKSVMDCGFNKMKPGGLFSKVTHEGVSAYVSRWIKNGWIRLDLGKGEKELARIVALVVALHGQRRGARRSVRFGGYGPRFDEPRAPGERGEIGELI